MAKVTLTHSASPNTPSKRFLPPSHIRKEPPTEDAVLQNLTPPWKAVRYPSPLHQSE